MPISERFLVGVISDSIRSASKTEGQSGAKVGGAELPRTRKWHFLRLTKRAFKEAHLGDQEWSFPLKGWGIEDGLAVSAGARFLGQ